jgi:indolepyruvate decarboxylase
MNLTEYLFFRLKELGVTHTFGIPGDFVLPIFAVQDEVGMKTVICAHEPGVGFAADAYARMKGIGVAVVTYGAGALNLINPVACAYAEQSPLLVVSGGPEVALRRSPVALHHVVRDCESQLRIFRELTVDAAILDDASTAGATIDRVLGEVIRRKRPGYLEIPRDRVRAEVLPPNGPLVVPSAESESDALFVGALTEAVGEIVSMLERATRPAMYVGVGVRRHGLTEAAVTIAERLRLPVATDVLGKASFPESHPQFAGVYMGALGDPVARDLLDTSDCVLSLGVVRTDTSTGFWTEKIAPDALIDVQPEAVNVRYHRFDNLPIRRLVSGVLDRVQSIEVTRKAPRFDHASEVSRRGSDDRLALADVLAGLRGLDQSKYAFIADVGDSWFLGLELRADAFIAPGFYASMGFAVPGALGIGLAEPSRRPFVLVGDGAFQMTGTELATIVEQKIEPIVLLLNNSSYGMLEALDGHHWYYDRRPWDYAAMAVSLGCPAERVETGPAFQEALARAVAGRGPRLIEARLCNEDLSPFMSRIKQFVRARNQPLIQPLG